MSNIITQCPSCNSKDLNVVKIECDACKTKFEGNFDIPKLLQLGNDDLNFIINFVRCSGSLKEMSKIHNVSYPTFRNQLNRLIERLDLLENKEELTNNKVLSLLETGQITVAEAAVLLENLKNGK